MKCTAKLTTLTHTDEVVAGRVRFNGGPWYFRVSKVPDGTTVTRDGDELQRDDVTVVTCQRDAGHEGQHSAMHRPSIATTDWEDGWPGATGEPT